MVELYNNYFRVTETPEIMFELSRILTLVEGEMITKLYTMEDQSTMIIPRGLGNIVPYLQTYEDKTTHNIDISRITQDVSSILPGITLRDDQVNAVSKMILAKRGIIQMGTGSGKTECIVAFVELLTKELGYTPNTLVIAPTTRLVDDTISRFEKYGITAIKYNKRRGHIDGIVVTHPMSVNNDISKNPNLLDELQVLICDEGHHLSADSYMRIATNAKNLEYCLALSATVVDMNKLPITDLSQLSPDEALVVGATGNVLVNMPPSYYIERGILANPVLIRMSNLANQYVRKSRDWHSIRKTVLESSTRVSLASDIVAYFSALGYKSLILVDTKECAKKLVSRLAETGNSDTCRVSFGGGEFLKWDETQNNLSTIDQATENTIDLFGSGESKILIGTSHIFEGFDVPNLDVVVIFSVGKSTRKIVQGIGRVLRKTKNTKYAYIIDFTDHENGILGNHSFQRLQICRTVIGVPDTQIYNNLSFQEFKFLIASLEGLL